jgi:integrase
MTTQFRATVAPITKTTAGAQDRPHDPIRSVQVHRRLRWMLDYRQPDGTRVRQTFPTKAEAAEEFKRVRSQRTTDRDEWATATPAERTELMELYHKAKERGLDLTTLLVRPAVQTTPTVTLGEAIRETVRVKTTAGCRGDYVKGLEWYLGYFARGREEMPLGSVTPPLIEAWFDARGEAPTTKASNLGRLAALFSLAVRRGWLPSNPIERLERPRLEAKPQKVLSNRQTARALIWCVRYRPEFLAWLSLSLLAGLRPDEARQITWGDIRLDEGLIDVGAAASKVRDRRIVHQTKQATEWLGLAQRLGAQLPLTKATKRRRLRELRDALRLKAWPQDVLRKTAASNLFAAWQDAARVAAELGTSERMLFRNYRAVVRKQHAQAWLALRPKKRWDPSLGGK